MEFGNLDFNLNFDYEKLQQQQITTFIDKHDLEIILDALDCRDDISRFQFRQKYSQADIKHITDTITGGFTDFKGKTIFVSNALIASATVSLIVLAQMTKDEFGALSKEKVEKLSQAYDVLKEYYTQIKEKIK